MKFIKNFLTIAFFYLLSTACNNSVTETVGSSDIAVETPEIKVDSAMSISTDSIKYARTIQAGTVAFIITSPNDRVDNKLTIKPAGFEMTDNIVEQVNGKVYDAFTGDINKDSYPELYCLITNQNGTGKLFAYSSNKNKSISAISMPDLLVDKKLGMGYRGNDEFKIENSRLVQTFPIYKPNDSASTPSGGSRSITYKLIPGETSWIFKVENSKDTK